MVNRRLIDPGASPVRGQSRRHVLEVLRAAEGALDVHHVAEHVGLHPNTARFHLDGLVEAGLVERRTEDRVNPGRPRMVYRCVATEASAGRRSYRLLSEMLTSMVAGTTPQPQEAAITTGEAWGRSLADRPGPSQQIDAEEGIRRLTTVLTEAGFEPDTIAEQTNPVIPLRHCPFREAAEQNREVVCSLHLGLMRGVLTEVGAPLRADRLEPFVEPSLCRAHLSAAPPRRTTSATSASTRGSVIS